MQFTPHSFSKRKPQIMCAVFVLHEPPCPYRATGAAIIMESCTIYVGVSICAPSDQFIKVVGLNKAVGRAYQSVLRGKPTCVATTPILPDPKGAFLVDVVKICLQEAILRKKRDMGHA